MCDFLSMQHSSSLLSRSLARSIPVLFLVLLEGVVRYALGREYAGIWRTSLVTSADKFIKISPNISLQMAATLAINPTTAYRMLKDFVALEPGMLSYYTVCHVQLTTIVMSKFKPFTWGVRAKKMFPDKFIKKKPLSTNMNYLNDSVCFKAEFCCGEYERTTKTGSTPKHLSSFLYTPQETV